MIDHKEIYEECAKKHGKPIDLAVKSTYNPKTKKYFGFSDSFVPDPVNYRIDLWTEQGMPHGPTSWEDVLHVGKKIKDKPGIPVGIGLSSELDTAMAMRTILYAFGGSVQDEQGKVVLDSPHTRDAVTFVKELYEQTMTPEVMAWDASSNNRAMLAGKVSLVLNAISTTRAAENKATADRRQARAHTGVEGPRARDRPRARDGLLRHLEIRGEHRGREEIPRRLHRQLRAGLQGQRVLQLPVLPHHRARHQGAARERSPGKPLGKYKVLDDVLHWATNVGYPGYANAAIDEIFNTWVLNTMFAKAATGTMPIADAIKEADSKCKAIFAKWDEKGLV